MTGPEARTMLRAAEWAGARYARYDLDQVRRIVDGAAQAGFAKAAEYARWAVEETGFGVEEHKRTKNEIASLGIAEHYRNEDFVSPVIDAERKLVTVPRPAGVIVALTPSTNPISTLYFKVILALMTRNAIVISPHPMAKGCCASAARELAEVADRAGAPADLIQVVEEPSIPVVEALIGDPRTNVIVATGGTAVVRATYSSGNPALGVGPGNAPAVVDASADLAAAARNLVDSVAFDNSLLCSSESTIVAERAVADRLLAEMRTAGAYVCDTGEVERLRQYLAPDGRERLESIGKSASWVASEVGIRANNARALVAPIDLVIGEDPLTHEKMCPVVSFVASPDFTRAISVARTVLRIAGAGHSAAIHSADPARVLAFATAVDVLRVVVNAPNSTGVAGFDTNLAPTMTVGTGFVGGSSLGENLGPGHLVNRSVIAYNSDAGVSFPDFAGHRASQAPVGHDAQPADDVSSELREQIREMVLDELRELGAER